MHTDRGIFRGPTPHRTRQKKQDAKVDSRMRREAYAVILPPRARETRQDKRYKKKKQTTPLSFMPYEPSRRVRNLMPDTNNIDNNNHSRCNRSRSQELALEIIRLGILSESEDKEKVDILETEEENEKKNKNPKERWQYSTHACVRAWKPSAHRTASCCLCFFRLRHLSTRRRCRLACGLDLLRGRRFF